MDQCAESHSIDVQSTVHRLQTDIDHGLTHEEARHRLSLHGPNALDETDGPRLWHVLLSQFHNPLIYVLLGSAAITLVIGHAIDSAVILAVVLVNAVIGFIQEWRAGIALAALAELTTTSATVLREGASIRIPSTEVVPGDVIAIEAGDRVPADLRLTDVRDLQVDEANLTGESVPVHKHPEVLSADTTLADRVNMAYSGTLVTAGRGSGISVGTGNRTEMGRIHQLMGSAEGVQTPLTRKLTRFSQWLTVIILGLAGVTFILGVVRGESAADMVTAAVALAVGAIPEGLPAAVTITLAIGVSRMARRNAIVRRLPAVETLGSTTVICTDKTGTLTENKMTVQVVNSDDGTYDLSTLDSPLSESVRDCLLAGVLCNDASTGSSKESNDNNVGDPTEVALIVAAREADPGILDEASYWERVQEIPFSSELRFMATLHRHRDESVYWLVVKGAVEELLTLTTSSRSEDVLRVTDELGSQALRVMGFASATVTPDFSLTLQSLQQAPLRFLGLQAMIDPPRQEVIPAIEACHTAGITVKMITGDHRTTAEAIANRIGLHASDGESLTVLTGNELSSIEPTERERVIVDTDVFARVTAEQKLDIVRALQKDGGVVAMTGDGVNDAPAIKQADIGVAMGLGGTEVAKETAEIVLTDDDFATIEAAVEEGRGVFDNLTKFITWTLPTNLGEGLVILAAIMLGSTLPILPVQILWINMTTAVALGLMLAFEPKESDIMTRPPRRPDQSIVTGNLLLRIAVVGALMLLGSFGLFTAAVDSGANVAEARTLAVNAFVAMEIGYLFNCRSLHRSVLSVGLFSNRWLWFGVVTTIGLQAVFTYAPFMNTVFDTAPLPISAWWPVIALGIAIYTVIGAIKWVDNRRPANFRQSVGDDQSLRS